MKKIILLLGIIVAGQGIARAAMPHPRIENVWYNSTSFQPNDSHTFRGTFFAWDVNGVILINDKSWLNGMGRMYNEQYSWSEIYSALSKTWGLWQEKKRLKKLGDPRGYVWDALLYEVEQTDPDFIKMLRHFTVKANSLNYQVAALLQELARDGHHHVIISNIGAFVLAEQIRFFKEQLDTGSTLSLDQQQLMSFTLWILSNHTNNVISGPENGWGFKPQPLLYQLSLERNPHAHERLKIFIDDKPKNIIAALQNGFDVGILYQDAYQLRQALAELSHGRLCITDMHVL